jgi:DNA topoisomerase-1
MNVLIIESPGKQKTIQGFLGSEWRVVASMGHIRGLTHDLNFLTNGYEPTYEFLKEKSKAIATLKEAAKGAEVYLAADRDFEGEQIAYSIKVLLKLKNVKRITFTEITEKAIRHAIANPGIIDMNRVHTQQARSLLDLLIGFTMSPLLWKHVTSTSGAIIKGLSAGRCQIPSIRLVVEREDTITEFKTESSWGLSADWIYQGTEFLGTMDDDLEDEESAMNYMENVANIKGTVIANDVKPWTAAAPPPLMTSTLQQQASALFGMNPKTTMMIAQRLYEAGHITYMRTDKAVLSEEAVTAIRGWVTENYGVEYTRETGKQKKEAKAKAKVGLSAQEAHEAIRPTHIERTTVEGDGASLYRLIWQRTVQSVMSPALGETCTVKINLDDFLWTARWKHTTFPGWQIIGRVAQIDGEEEEKDDDSMWNKAIQIPVGAIVGWTIMKAATKETKAAGRYTEATLIRELEKYGIGRPSTFASLLATIQEKQYITVSTIPARTVKVKEHTLAFGSVIESTVKEKKIAPEKNKLVPTPLGRSVLTFMLEHFDDLFNYEFTGHMEQRLDLVAEGKEDWKAVVHDTWTSYKDRYDALNKKEREPKEKKTKEKIELGEWNGQPIEKKTGKFGEYIQCGEISVPFLMEPLEEIIKRLDAKLAVKKTEFKEYTVRIGEYSPYIIKKGLKKPRFISIPKEIDISALTHKDVEGLYKMGLDKKYKK